MRIIKVKCKDAYSWKDISSRNSTNYSTQSKVHPKWEWHCGTWNDRTVDTNLWISRDWSLTSGDLKRMLVGSTINDKQIEKETRMNVDEFRMLIPELLKEFKVVASEARKMMKDRGDIY